MGLGEVREHTLLDHRDLRSRLTEIEALAISVASGRRDGAQRARRRRARLFFDPDLLRDDDVFAEVETG